MNRLVASALLLGLSILIYGLATQIYPRYREHLFVSTTPSIQDRLSYPLVELGLCHFLRLLYYIGLPYLALRQGIIPTNLMGLGEWTATEDEALKTIGLMLLTLLFTLLSWWNYARSLANPNDRLPLSELVLCPASAPEPIAATLEVIYLQTHWAFYRSVALLWLGGDHYEGVWLGLILVILEELLNPEIRRMLVRPGASMIVLLRWGIALFSSVAFLLSHSLWFVVLLHWPIEMSNISLRHRLNHRGQSGGEQAA